MCDDVKKILIKLKTLWEKLSVEVALAFYEILSTLRVDWFNLTGQEFQKMMNLRHDENIHILNKVSALI